MFGILPFNPIIQGVTANFIHDFLRGHLTPDTHSLFERLLTRTTLILSDIFDPLPVWYIDDFLSRENIQLQLSMFRELKPINKKIMIAEFQSIHGIDTNYWSEERVLSFLNAFFSVLQFEMLGEPKLAPIVLARMIGALNASSYLEDEKIKALEKPYKVLRVTFEHLFRYRDSKSAGLSLLKGQDALAPPIFKKPSGLLINLVKEAQNLLSLILQDNPGNFYLHLFAARLADAVNDWSVLRDESNLSLTYASTTRQKLQSLLFFSVGQLMAGNFIKMQDSLKEILATDPSFVEKDISLHALYFLAWLDLYQGRPILALRKFAAIAPAAKAEVSPIFSADIFHFIGRSFLSMGKPEPAATFLNRAKTGHSRHGPFPIDLAHDLRYLAECSIHSGDFETAESQLKESKKLFFAHKDSVQIAHVPRHMARLHLRKGTPHLAISGLADALQIWQTAGYRKGIADACLLLGICYESQDMCEDATLNYIRAWTTFHDLGMPETGMAQNGLIRMKNILGPVKFKRIYESMKEITF